MTFMVSYTQKRTHTHTCMENMHLRGFIVQLTTRMMLPAFRAARARSRSPRQEVGIAGRGREKHNVHLTRKSEAEDRRGGGRGHMVFRRNVCVGPDMGECMQVHSCERRVRMCPCAYRRISSHVCPGSPDAAVREYGIFI